MVLLTLVPCLAAAIFVAAVVVRWIKLARMPQHLRWELYPVAHERNAGYGGSFFEQLEWWKHEPKPNHLGGVRVMVPEILLLSGVREHNRKLWLRSFPFHFGLYTLAGFIGLLVLGAIAEIGGVRVARDAGGLAGTLSLVTIVLGAAGFALLGGGAVGLLLRRLGDPALRQHSAPADFANLTIFIFLSTLALCAFAFADRDFGMLRAFVRGLLPLSPAEGVPLLVAAEIVAGSAILAYIPLTHMSHFFTKWFLYHDIRWNDEVNRVGSKLEAAIGEQLGRKVSWNATHIAGGGKKTWAEVATERVSDGGLCPVALDAGDGKNPPRVLSQEVPPA
jgi:nitrate reductase gamma subunit